MRSQNLSGKSIRGTPARDDNSDTSADSSRSQSLLDVVRHFEEGAGLASDNKCSTNQARSVVSPPMCSRRMLISGGASYFVPTKCLKREEHAMNFVHTHVPL